MMSKDAPKLRIRAGRDRVIPGGGASGLPSREKNFQRMSIPPRLVRRMSIGARAGPGIRGDKTMRVMVLVKATKDSEAGIMPSTELFEAMGRFNEELAKAGIMLTGDGLKPTSQGKRGAVDGPGRTVIDGPFAETRELVAGFWI